MKQTSANQACCAIALLLFVVGGSGCSENRTKPAMTSEPPSKAAASPAVSRALTHKAARARKPKSPMSRGLGLSLRELEAVHGRAEQEEGGLGYLLLGGKLHYTPYIGRLEYTWGDDEAVTLKQARVCSETWRASRKPAYESDGLSGHASADAAQPQMLHRP